MIRAKARTLVASVGYGLGLTQLASVAGDRWKLLRGGSGVSIGRRAGNDSFLVLIYHRVINRRGLLIERTSPDLFGDQMRYLAHHFHVLPLGELVSMVRSGSPLPPRAVALTFDDGYEDNYIHAFPILQKLELPATIFLTTGWVDTDVVPWFDRVLHAFAHTTRDSVELPDRSGRARFVDPTTRKRVAIDSLYALMRVPNAERLVATEGLIEELLDGASSDPPRNEMLRWSQVREMVACGISFGAHTVSHPILTRLPEEEIRRELVESKSRIEAETGTPVTLLAYPVGRPVDYSPEVLRLASEAGFEAALTTVVGVNRRGDDLMLLRRIKPLGSDLPSFAMGMALHYLTEWSPRS